MVSTVRILWLFLRRSIDTLVPSCLMLCSIAGLSTRWKPSGRRKVRAPRRLLRRGLDATQLDPRPDHREEHAVAVPLRGTYFVKYMSGSQCACATDAQVASLATRTKVITAVASSKAKAEQKLWASTGEGVIEHSLQFDIADVDK